MWMLNPGKLIAGQAGVGSVPHGTPFGARDHHRSRNIKHDNLPSIFTWSHNSFLLLMCPELNCLHDPHSYGRAWVGGRVVGRVDGPCDGGLWTRGNVRGV